MTPLPSRTLIFVSSHHDPHSLTMTPLPSHNAPPPGDIVTFQDLLRTLPIESSLTQPAHPHHPPPSSHPHSHQPTHKPYTTSVMDTTNATTGRGNTTTNVTSRGGGGSVSTRNTGNAHSRDRPSSAPPRRNSTGTNHNSSLYGSKSRF